MKKTLLLLTLLALVACSGGKTKNNEEQGKQNKTQTTEVACSHFALSNRTGSKFLFIFQENDTEQNPCLKAFEFAIHNGKAYRIKFSGIQKENEKNNGRQAHYNFDNLSGAIFDNLDGQILPPKANEYDGVFETVLLVNQTFLNENRLLPLTQYGQEQEKADKSTVKALEEHYKRKVMNAYKVVSFGENGRNIFVSAQFENKGNKALGAYVLETADGKRAYLEFPATVETDENGYVNSVWRVDDGGDFVSPTITAVFDHFGQYEFMIDDMGAEGVTSYFIRIIGDKLVADDKEGRYYRYAAPE